MNKSLKLLSLCEVEDDDTDPNLASPTVGHFFKNRDSGVASIKPGQWKKMSSQAPGYSSNKKAYAARNKKGELSWFATEDGAKKHASQG